MFAQIFLHFGQEYITVNEYKTLQKEDGWMERNKLHGKFSKFLGYLLVKIHFPIVLHSGLPEYSKLFTLLILENTRILVV